MVSVIAPSQTFYLVRGSIFTIACSIQLVGSLTSIPGMKIKWGSLMAPINTQVTEHPPMMGPMVVAYPNQDSNLLNLLLFALWKILPRSAQLDSTMVCIFPNQINKLQRREVLVVGDGYENVYFKYWFTQNDRLMKNQSGTFSDVKCGVLRMYIIHFRELDDFPQC